MLARASARPSASERRVQRGLTYAFTSLWIAEMLFKWVAYGVRGYFRDPFNAFDFALVSLGVIQLALDSALSNVFSLLRVLRVARLSRVFRLASTAASRHVKGSLGTLTFAELT